MNTTQKILILDDEEMVRDAVSMVLQRSGFDTTTAATGIQAVKLCEEQNYDLIITDLVMPEMDGEEFVRTIRQTDQNTPIIAFTGGARHGDQNLTDRTMKAGANLVLRKPVNKAQLLGAIEEVLGSTL